MSDSSTHQNTSTPSRPPNRHRQTRSSPQVPTTGTGKKNNFNNKNRRSNNNNNPNHGQQYQNQQQQPRQESALTKKFREAAQIDNGAASDSAINSIVEKGIVTPPATPGSTNHRREPNAYVSDSAIGTHANGKGKQNLPNKKKGKGKRGTDIPNNGGVQHFTPPKQQYTPPDDILFGKPTPGRYAGACFHASPAANALPLPKFFSKSVPTTSEAPTLSKMLAEAEADAAVRTQMIADSPPPTAPLRTPLDIFFQADKEEKARKALAAISQSEVASPQPLANPANESHMVRNITPPSAALPNGLGSPFGGRSVKRDDSENDRDMLFAMDFSEKKPAPRPVEEVVIGPRHRPLSAKACDPETHLKRTEKANQIKAALMRGSQPFDLQGPPSPSPNPRFNAVEIPDAAGGVPLSPTIHERRTRTNNVGFAPAPRIRHFNQNRPVNSKANGQHRNGNGRTNNQNFHQNVQSNFQDSNGNNAQTFDPVRARMAESHIRGVLKLDSPIPAI
ncbi:uncharacterized protein DFL_007741 [Arthrobotrys flagrans]|uniref:Uncharacterized protein n=1 Tax=Arthrobotrys flagrans TaxID=97331 RepID=A0A436ZWL9_ARTFL|nr:hypothetical protein DFL_007741 [Arthrobotrys flagrans]